jgi:hypothetical protein
MRIKSNSFNNFYEKNKNKKSHKKTLKGNEKSQIIEEENNISMKNNNIIYPVIKIDPSFSGICTYGFGTNNFTIVTSRPENITELLVLKGVLKIGTDIYDSWCKNPWQYMLKRD